MISIYFLRWEGEKGLVPNQPSLQFIAALTSKWLNQTTKSSRSFRATMVLQLCFFSSQQSFMLLNLLHFWHYRYIPIMRSLQRHIKTNAKGQKQFCRLPRKRNTLLKFMDRIWTQTNGRSIDFNRDKVLLQLFLLVSAWSPAASPAWKPGTCQVGWNPFTHSNSSNTSKCKAIRVTVSPGSMP